MDRIRLCAFADEADPSIEGQIKALRRNGIGLLEIRGVNGQNISEVSEKELRDVKKRLDSEGISVWSIGSPIGKSPISEDFSVQSDLFKGILDKALLLDAKCVRLFSFRGTDGKPEYRDEVLYRLSEFVGMARGSGVTLCHENEKGIYGDTAARCLEIHKNIPELKAVFDPANFVQCGEDAMNAWRMLRGYVYYGHVKDADGDMNIVPAGHGIGKIPEYVKDFLERGTGVMTLEPHLVEFVGLKGLEDEKDSSDIGSLSFESADAAFDFACRSFKSLLDGVNISYC